MPMAGKMFMRVDEVAEKSSQLDKRRQGDNLLAAVLRCDT